MTQCDTIGYLASGLVLITFAMKDMIQLRIVAMCSNVAFIAYGLSLGLPPVVVLHAILLPMNSWRLWEVLSTRSDLGGSKIGILERLWLPVLHRAIHSRRFN